MRISGTNYQPSFKSLDYSEDGIKLLMKRLPGYKFEAYANNLEKSFRNKDYKIIIGTDIKNKNRLNANIQYDKNNTRYIKENYLSYLFNKPYNFIKKIHKQIKKDLMKISSSGRI